MLESIGWRAPRTATASRSPRARLAGFRPCPGVAVQPRRRVDERARRCEETGSVERTADTDFAEAIGGRSLEGFSTRHAGVVVRRPRILRSDHDQRSDRIVGRPSTACLKPIRFCECETSAPSVLLGAEGRHGSSHIPKHPDSTSGRFRQDRRSHLDRRQADQVVIGIAPQVDPVGMSVRMDLLPRIRDHGRAIDDFQLLLTAQVVAYVSVKDTCPAFRCSGRAFETTGLWRQCCGYPSRTPFRLPYDSARRSFVGCP